MQETHNFTQRLDKGIDSSIRSCPALVDRMVMVIFYSTVCYDTSKNNPVPALDYSLKYRSNRWEFEPHLAPKIFFFGMMTMR